MKKITHPLHLAAEKPPHSINSACRLIEFTGNYAYVSNRQLLLRFETENLFGKNHELLNGKYLDWRIWKVMYRKKVCVTNEGIIKVRLQEDAPLIAAPFTEPEKEKLLLGKFIN